MGGAGRAVDGNAQKRVGFFPYSWQQFFTDKSGSSTASQRDSDNQHRLELLRARLRVEPKKPILKRTSLRNESTPWPSRDPDWLRSRMLVARGAAASDCPSWAAMPPAAAAASSSWPSALGLSAVVVDVPSVRAQPSTHFEQHADTSRRPLGSASSEAVGGASAGAQLIGSCPSPLPHCPAGIQARRNHRASIDAAACAVVLATRMASVTGPLQPPAGLTAGSSATWTVQEPLRADSAARSHASGDLMFRPDPREARMQARTAALDAVADLRYVRPKHESAGVKASAWRRFIALVSGKARRGGGGGAGAVAATDGSVTAGPDVGEAEEPLPVVRSTDSAMVHRKRMGLDGRPKRLVRAGPVGRSDGERTTHPGEESEVDCMDAEVMAAAEAFTAAASAASATGRGFLTGAGGTAAAGGGVGRTRSSSDSGSSDGWEEDRDFTPIGTANGAVSVQDEDDERAAWAAAAVASAPLPISAHVYRMDSAVPLSGEAQVSVKTGHVPSSSAVPGRGRSFRVRSAAPGRS